MARRMTRKKSKAIQSTLFYLLVLALLTALAYGYQWLNNQLQDRLASFRLEDIEINGNEILSRREVLELCGLKDQDEGLLSIKPAKVVRRLRKSFYVKNAAAVRSLPAKLRIVIEERRPVAFIYGRGLNLIDDEGVLMPVPHSHKTWNLPFISGVEEALGSLGHKTVSVQALKGLEILNFLHSQVLPLNELVSEIIVKDSKVVKLRLIQGGAIVKIEQNNYRENLYILSEFINHYMPWEELTQIDYIDLRFKDQLIVKPRKG